MKRLFLLIFVMAGYFCASQAQPISQDDARKKAANFYFDNMIYRCIDLKEQCSDRTTYYSYDKSDAALARICTPSQDGYFTDKNVTITGIQSVEDVDLNNSEIYNVQGVRVPTLHKGLNIIKMSDGTTKKVMIK